jgi:DNA-binding NarL/FixJ family response regulator
MTQSIKIAIVDDNITIRSGLRMLVSNLKNVSLVREAGFSESFNFIANEPEIVLFRLEQKENQKILSFIRKFHEKYPSIRLLILAHSCNDPFILQSFKAGVKGCLLKESSLVDLEFAIREIYKGNMIIPSLLKEKLVNHIPLIEDDDEDDLGSSDGLSGQQARVLRLMAHGCSNGEIAEKLFISKRTVDMHAYRLFKRLNVSSRKEAVKVALEQGLIDS